MTGNVVILGASGFVGRAVLDALQNLDVEVAGFSSHELDLRDGAQLSLLDEHIRPDTVVMVASALTPDKGANSFEALGWNQQMCLNLASYLERRPFRRCVYVSSDAVYPFLHVPVTEESPVEPASFYALAKYAGERIFARLAELTQSGFLNLRLTGIYGPGDTHNSYGPNRFIKSIVRSGTVQLFGEGAEQRDHLYIADAAQLIAHLIRTQAEGTYNVATGRSCSFSGIVELLREIVPVSFDVIHAPGQPVTHRHFDVSRLFLAAPEFAFTSLHDGLRASYEAAAA